MQSTKKPFFPLLLTYQSYFFYRHETENLDQVVILECLFPPLQLTLSQQIISCTSMSLNPGKIRIFLIFKSQNFLIEKKIFALRAKIFCAQQEKIFFCCCRPAVRGGHIFLPTTVPYPRIRFQDFWGRFVFPPRCFFSSDQRRHWGHRELYFIFLLRSKRNNTKWRRRRKNNRVRCKM